MPLQPVLRRGDSLREIVMLVQQRLNQLGCGPIDEDGVFGGETESALKLLQTRRGLTVDGVVGPQTWATLFTVEAPRAAGGLSAEALAIAARQIGVKEASTNRGVEVDAYVSRVGLDPAGRHPWCQAFIYYCFDEAAKRLGMTNPCVRTASVMQHWIKAQGRAAVLGTSVAADRPELVSPGMVFIIDHGHGKGHAGFVERVEHGGLVTIEGNTNVAGGREGDGVYRRTRTFLAINLGFIEYAPAV